MTRHAGFIVPGLPQHAIQYRYQRTGTLWEGRNKSTLLDSGQAVSLPGAISQLH